MLIIGNQEIETDTAGYLKHHEQWDRSVAEVLATEEQITMTAAHWEVVLFVRDFYLEYKTSPAIRALVKAMEKKYGPEKGSSKYLYQLFPKGPAKQATRIAGLPKPVKCI